MLSNNACPCCRNDFLAFSDDENDTNDDGDNDDHGQQQEHPQQQQQGMALFTSLGSQLRSLIEVVGMNWFQDTKNI